jgi:hypothetical protein
LAQGAKFTLADPQETGEDNGAQFRCVVVSGETSATSDPATLTVGSDTTPPTLVRVLGDTDPALILVSFSEPLDLGTAQEPGNYTMKVDGVLDPTFTIGSAVLTNGTNVLLTTTARVPGKNYVLVVNNVSDAAAVPNPIAPNSELVMVSQTILLNPASAEQLWDWDDSNVDRTGTGWEVYGDLGGTPWKSDTAGRGPQVFSQGADVGNAPFNTVGTMLAAPATSGITTYFRTRFTLYSPPAETQFVFEHVIDDGAVFYINGVDVLRVRMPTGPVNGATAGLSGVSETGDIHPTEVSNILTSALVLGENIVAVEVHQTGNTSSDILMGARLVATASRFVPVVETAIGRNETGDIVITWPGTATLEESDDPGGPYTTVTGATSPYTVPTPLAERKFYRLLLP